MRLSASDRLAFQVMQLDAEISELSHRRALVEAVCEGRPLAFVRHAGMALASAGIVTTTRVLLALDAEERGR